MFSKIINKLKELLGINNKISKQEEINIFSNIKVGDIVWANRYENKEELEKRKQIQIIQNSKSENIQNKK